MREPLRVGYTALLLCRLLTVARARWTKAGRLSKGMPGFPIKYMHTWLAFSPSKRASS